MEVEVVRSKRDGFFGMDVLVSRSARGKGCAIDFGMGFSYIIDEALHGEEEECSIACHSLG